jgi:hypothetical protein
MSPSFSFIKPVSLPKMRKTKASPSAHFTYQPPKAANQSRIPEPYSHSRISSLKA